tara:strand:+ start:163 stop:672 length:510 start_codon:yes stop_codon:yes gene_type:complete
MSAAKPNIKKHIESIIRDQNKYILRDLCNTYSNLNYDELYAKYCPHALPDKKKKKTKTVEKRICMAKKADGYQCTRRRRDNSDYCGKHINKIKFGRIDDEEKYASDEKYIKTTKTILNGDYYLVDEANTVYSYSKTSPVLIGKCVDGELILARDYINSKTSTPATVEIV